jgi:hypothetical protein
MGRESILQSNFEAKIIPCSEVMLKGINSHLEKLIFIPDNYLKHISIH